MKDECGSQSSLSLAPCCPRLPSWALTKIRSVSRAQRSASRKASGALQTPISGLPEIGTQMHAGRINPTCVDRYAHHLREGPGSAAHRFAAARAAPHPGPAMA